MTKKRAFKFMLVETAATNVEVRAESEQEARERIERADPAVEWFDTVRGPMKLVRLPDGGS
ncbi:MAG: hypothetical protein CME38_09370 [Haliea sp.]|nr:hypothetical protein [Haliea sp.]|tara:strand:+ start:3824 stop:4006 length:183 start_codon:yes stop_codon:yes gene_type:complete